MTSSVAPVSSTRRPAAVAISATSSGRSTDPDRRTRRATSRAEVKAQEVVKLYGKRFSIEETFRDEKDLHFGLGLSSTHIKDAARRDRLLFLVALAHALLTLLGAASEETELDRTLKANTSKKRTHSLFRQGSYWYQAMPNMRDDWFEKLMTAFDRIVAEHRVFVEIFAVI